MNLDPVALVHWYYLKSLTLWGRNTGPNNAAEHKSIFQNIAL